MPDILLTPTNPISTSFHVKGLTCEGRAYVGLRWPSMMISGQLEMAVLKALCKRRNLTVETDWTCAGKAMAS